jgi:hypothetical protein
MKGGSRAVLVAAGGIVGGAAAAVAVGGRLWDRTTASCVRRLRAGGSASHGELFSPDQLEGLPDPVARYFEFALTAGQPLLRSARAEQNGEFRSGGRGTRWNPMTARQHFAVDPPGFVWDASIRLAPLLTIRVRDRYVGGAGSMQGKIASLFTWAAIDDTRACATLVDAGTSVALTFQFDPSGAILRAHTDARYREVKTRYVPTPWACSYRSYAQVNGMWVPMEAEVEWILPEGRLPYWRGRVMGIEHAFAR